MLTLHHRPHLSTNDDFLPQEDKLNTALRELREEREIIQRLKEQIKSGYSDTTYNSSTEQHLSE